MNMDELRSMKSATLTIAQVAELLDVDPRTATKGIEEGTIPSIRLGRRVVIPRERLLALLTVD